MIFTYRTDGCTISPKDKQLIETKLNKLNHLGHRIDDESTKIHIEVVRGTRHNSPNYGMRVQLTIPSHSLRAKASDKTISSSLDEIERILRSQITKLK